MEHMMVLENPFSNKGRKRNIHIVSSLIPVIVLWLRYHKTISSWWMPDDPAILWTIIENGIFPHFYKPDVWSSFSATNLTPWLQLSLGLDWRLFGLHPDGFYWHHMLSFSLMLLAAYRILVFRFQPVIASFVLILFVLSTPAADVLHFLMVRHYLEGLALALAAYYCYTLSICRKNYFWSLTGAIFYLLSVTAKEIYVPLLIVLPLFSFRICMKRWELLVPYVGIAAGYVLWRAYMLNFGNMVSGYQHIAPPGITDFINFPHTSANLMGWRCFWQKAAVILGCGSVFFSMNNRSFSIYAKLGIWLIVLFFPIIPVVSILNTRYLFLPVFMIFVFIGDNMMHLWNKKTHRYGYRLFVICLGMTLLISMFQTTDSVYALNCEKTEDQFHKEGEFVLHGLNDQSSLVNPLGPPWYFWGLKQLRQHVLGMSSGPGVCYDSYFCDELKCHKAYQYADHELIQIEWPDNRDSYRWVKPSAQLSCELSYVPGRVQWHFGPYTDGIYKLVTYDKLNHILGSSMQLAPQNIISLQLQAVLDFILEYDSPEGWKTFSPVLELNPNVHDISKAHVQWTRNEIK